MLINNISWPWGILSIDFLHQRLFKNWVHHTFYLILNYYLEDNTRYVVKINDVK